MKTLTFYDLTFRAKHAIDGKSEAASAPHWHSYTVRLWFENSPDQDALSEELEEEFAWLHGANLHCRLKDSSDEGIAVWFMRKAKGRGCVRVTVTNDGRRGAEVSQ